MAQNCAVAQAISTTRAFLVNDALAERRDRGGVEPAIAQEVDDAAVLVPHDAQHRRHQFHLN